MWSRTARTASNAMARAPARRARPVNAQESLRAKAGGSRHRMPTRVFHRPFKSPVDRSMSLRYENPAEAFVQPERTCLIRRGSPDDAQALSAFATRTFVDTYGAYNHPDNVRLHLAGSYTVGQQREELDDPRVVTLLAYRDGQLAAFAQVRRSEAPACVNCDAAVELHRFYVDRVWHGQGVSHALLAEVRHAACAFDAATLWLKVWEHNPRAIAFYAKCHFVDVGVTDFFVGHDRQTDRVLTLDLRNISIAGAATPRAS